MQFNVASSPVEKTEADALAVICFETPKNSSADGHSSPAEDIKRDLTVADPAFAQEDQWLRDLRASGEFTGKLHDYSILHRPLNLAAKRLVVIGGGKRESFTPFLARRVAGVLLRALKPKGIHHLAFSLEGLSSSEEVVAVVEGFILGTWEADKYKLAGKKPDPDIDTVTLVPAQNGVSFDIKDAIRTGQIIGDAQNLARDLANEPANKLTPAALSEAAQRAASETGLEYEVLDTDAMTKLGMGALLGVAQGSTNPPYLIVLKYRPSASDSKSDHLAFVGKGVTFDTGGISIKPADGMEKMKYDMSGAAATIGAMKAIALLKPSVTVTGYIPTVENMLSGNAQRPGDIVTSMAGKTIEVINTDAEGRLILADAITYANSNGATHIVDAATLTGAIGIALGHHYMGAFTNDQALLDRFLASTKNAGEKTWQLPLEEEYKEYLKSAFADLPNVGGRYGGSITAAWFLKEFADPTPWVHLDIAATAWLDEAKPWMSKGPTGIAVRSFVHLALEWNKGS